MALLAGRMIWEFGYRRSKMEKIYRRIRTVYTTANTAPKIGCLSPLDPRRARKSPLGGV